MNFIGEGAQRERGDYRLYWVSLSLSERQPRQCHLVKILKAPQRILFWILFTVALGRLSLPSAHPLLFGFLSAEGHVNTCRKPFANPPLHTQLKRSSAFFLVAVVVVVVGRVSKLPNFFFGFSSAVSFLFCSLLLLALLAAAACRMPLPGGGYQRIILSKECGGCSSKLLWPKEKQRWLQREREWNGREGRGNGESEKWKVEKPNEKEREKYLLCSLVGFPVPCLLAPKAII